MGKQISITDAELAGFTQQAASDLENAVAKYKRDLLSEISRIEASQNTGGTGPEVTSAMVHDAELVYSRGPRYRRRKGWLNFLNCGRRGHLPRRDDGRQRLPQELYQHSNFSGDRLCGDYLQHRCDTERVTCNLRTSILQFGGR